jgi:hypothetical protein
MNTIIIHTVAVLLFLPVAACQRSEPAEDDAAGRRPPTDADLGHGYVESRTVEGMISAEVTERGLNDIRISPLPGSSRVPSVPDWQMEVFGKPGNLKRMIEAGRRIK